MIVVRRQAPNSDEFVRRSLRATHDQSGRCMGRSQERRKPMTVKAIVCRKGTDVVTIDPTASLASAAKTLATHRIGAVIITGADRQVVGILSERDIVRGLAERGSSALGEPVGQVMTPKRLTLSETDTSPQLTHQTTS